MTDKELSEIIEKLDSGHNPKSAYFGIFQYGGGPDESFIKATKDGLTKHALKILKALQKINAGEYNKENGTLSLEREDESIDSDTHLDFIELTTPSELKDPKPEYKETFIDKLMPAGCIGGLIFLVVAAIVGTVTIFKLIFS